MPPDDLEEPEVARLSGGVGDGDGAEKAAARKAREASLDVNGVAEEKEGQVGI